MSFEWLHALPLTEFEPIANALLPPWPGERTRALWNAVHCVLCVHGGDV